VDGDETLLREYAASQDAKAFAQLVADQSTVSRRIQKGVELLRQKLLKAGIGLSVVALVACLGQSSLHAAPAALKATLGKMAVAGVGASGAGAAASAAFFTTAYGRAVAAVAVGLIAVGGVVAYRKATGPERPQTGGAQHQPVAPPPGEGDRPSEPRKGKAIAPLEDALVTTYPKTAMLDGVPTGQGNSNSYVRGLEIALRHVGAPVDYDALMGLSGMAFITQSDLGSPLIDGAVDIGWWPMDSWGVRLRLGFLSRAVGVRLRAVDCDRDRFMADAAAHYRERFEAEVKASIAARRPVLAEHDRCFVVAGYDEGKPPLLGRWAPDANPAVIRIPEPPWGLILLGGELERLDPRAADLESLRHAIALWRETAAGSEGIDSGCYARKLPENRRLRFAGQRSFAEWAAALRDTGHLGQARWHANMRFHLGINRRSAVACLRAMAARHPEAVAAHLAAAASLYGQALAELTLADTGEAAMRSKEGRETLAKRVERLAALEGQAIAELEQALATALGMGFTAAQKQRLAQWGSMFGEVGKCIAAADREPVFYELLAQELALEPISAEARQIRDRMRFEPADMTYLDLVEMILRSIGAGRLAGPLPPVRTPERVQRLQRLVNALRDWTGGVSRDQARQKPGADAATVEEIYGSLGASDDDKRAVVALVIEKLDTGHSQRAVDIELREKPQSLEEALAHHVSMCDTQTWTFEHNLKILLGSIGATRVVKSWGEPDGPIGWSGPRAMNPAVVPRLRVIVAGLEAWLAGEPGEGDARAVVETLGQRDAYKEKRWLVRCLHTAGKGH